MNKTQKTTHLKLVLVFFSTAVLKGADKNPFFSSLFSPLPFFPLDLSRTLLELEKQFNPSLSFKDTIILQCQPAKVKLWPFFFFFFRPLPQWAHHGGGKH